MICQIITNEGMDTYEYVFRLEDIAYISKASHRKGFDSAFILLKGGGTIDGLSEHQYEEIKKAMMKNNSKDNQDDEKHISIPMFKKE